MRVLHYALVIAVVFAMGMASAQEKEQQKDKPIPWWKLSDDNPAKDQPRAKDDARAGQPERQQTRPDAKKKTPGFLFPVAPSDQPIAKSDKRPAPPASPNDWQPVEVTARQAPKPEPRERLVYRLANAPSTEVARTVNELLKSERAASGPPKPNTVVLADAVSNSLIISGTSDAIHETVKLVEQLDAEPLMVCVQAVIGLIESRDGLSFLAPNPKGPELSCSHEEACHLIEEFSKSDSVKILARPQIMTLDNQPAFLQIGHRVPRAQNLKDGTVVTTELENVGLILGFTPRITSDHKVTMEIDLEKSELSSEEDGIPLGVDSKGNVVRSPMIETTMVQTTVKIPPSRAVIIGGLALKNGDKQGELVLVVTPHIVAQKK